MLPSDNIDDLFRQKLDGHATPPAPDLWARLALPPAADADPVDAAFQDGLRGHATPPRRELWERLEDEHLRPQPRRRRPVVAWWQLSAAAVLLFVLVGGALWGGLWRGPASGPVASHHGGNNPAAGTTSAGHATAGTSATEAVTGTAPMPESAGSQAQNLATNQPALTAAEKNKEIFAPQATAPRPSPSSTPIASTTRPRRPATAPRASTSLQPQRSQPDVATGNLARPGGRKTPAGQSPTTPQPTSPVPTISDNNAPALAVATPPAAAPEVIEVEVRRGGGHPAPAVVAVAAVEAAPMAPTRRRGLRLGGLLRQADRLVHGESVNLAEATSLPESVTLQARLGGRVVSKTIQL
ncbi:MAG TPA: hypothetical protein VFO93_17205 [Hymenobacter sp.]|uniref:hypothetical protein n=1 Tax=Hymenobacter sp. TaxID=1898978 RepID=UPI002D7F3CD1|nr:hypothetical protein [Hymenobacter sp.]HET9505285.1 hypothetical protein [Hymenobacter sp.]